MHATTTDAAQPHEHPPFLAHHFDSPAQQFDAGKLGIWLFLITELLFFSGLFAAYAVYRNNHPEVFVYAHQFLDKSLGAMNTVVLLFSSLTMAWGVRCAQLGHHRGLAVCLTITLACAGFFLGVKGVEYTHKFHEGMLWAAKFQPLGHPESDQQAAHLTPGLRAFLILVGAGTLIGLGLTAWARWKQHRQATVFWGALGLTGVATLAGLGAGMFVPAVTRAYEKPPLAAAAATGAEHADHGTAAPAADKLSEPPAAATGETSGEKPTAPAESTPAEKPATASRPAAAGTHAGPRLAGVFFSIYFAMTGVHALHILAGMAVIAWLIWRATARHFGPQYFGPVDYVGLYWHLVDLVWIYLFPLLYLIH